MKTSLLILCSIIATFTANSQEVGQTEALKAASIAWLASAEITDAPLAVDPDIKQPFALTGGKKFGVMAIPETKLARELEHLREGITLIGQLWLKDLLPSVGGATITTDKLCTVSVTNGKDTMLLPLMFLGIQGSGATAKELVVFSMDKTPLFTVPLTPIDKPQKLPIEIKIDGGSELTLSIAGKWQAKFNIVPER